MAVIVQMQEMTVGYHIQSERKKEEKDRDRDNRNENISYFTFLFCSDLHWIRIWDLHILAVQSALLSLLINSKLISSQDEQSQTHRRMFNQIPESIIAQLSSQ